MPLVRSTWNEIKFFFFFFPFFTPTNALSMMDLIFPLNLWSNYLRPFCAIQLLYKLVNHR